MCNAVVTGNTPRVKVKSAIIWPYAVSIWITQSTLK